MYKKATVNLKIETGATLQVSKGHKVKRGDTLLEISSSEIDEFNLAMLLKVPPKKLKSYMLVKPGELVKAGEKLAQKKGLVSQQTVKAPVAGEFMMIDEERGIAGIKRSGESKKIKAWFSGTVDEITDREITFGVSGKVLTGKEGRGTPASGKIIVLGSVSSLTMPIDLENAIVVIKEASSDIIAKADALGAVAVVAEIVDLPPFSLPYILFSDIAEVNHHRDKWAIINGDEKQLLIVDEHEH